MRRRKILRAKKEIESEKKNSFSCYLTRFCPLHLNNVTFFVIAGFVFAADQLSKFWIIQRFSPGESWPLVPNIFHLTYVLNPGAAFGILAHRTVFFVVISLFLIVLIIVGGYFLPSRNFLLRFAFSLQLGGALGNFSDRVRTGYVVDFLDFLIWPVFNLADIALVLGIGVLFFVLLINYILPGS